MSVVVRFTSGLGNQLFQFAAGYVVATRNQTELIADTLAFIPSFNRQKVRATFRPFALADLGFPMRYRPIETNVFTKLRGYSRIRNLFLDGTKRHYSDEAGFQESFTSLTNNSVLTGYFQDIRYLMGREIEICEVIRKTLHSKFGEPRPIQCAIHIRRGDYLHHPEFFPFQFADYYRRCALNIEAQYGCTDIHVFSDDISWCRGNIRTSRAKLHFVEPDTVYSGALDLYTMANARILSIANSTFSWWAGLLGWAKGNTVIAPSIWSAWCESPCKSLYPSSWDVALIEAPTSTSASIYSE